MSLKLTDIAEELAIAVPIIVEAKQLAEPGTAPGTELDVPTIRVRVNGAPIDLDVKATRR